MPPQDRYIQALLAAEIVIDHSFAAFRARRDRIDARPTETFVGKLTRCDSNDIAAVSFGIIGPPRAPFAVLRKSPLHSALAEVTSMSDATRRVAIQGEGA